MKKHIMKKVLLFSLALIAVAAISSCKKDRLCVCTTEVSGSFNFSGTADTTFANVSKGDAETKCDGLNSSYSSGDESAVTTCELK